VSERGEKMRTIRANTPAELQALRQWVCWRYVERGGKATKMPCTVSGYAAKSTDAGDWCTFDEALQALERNNAAGVGIVFHADDPYCGVDLDHCIVDGQLAGWAREIVDALGGYTEVSPSGNGLKIWVRGVKPGTRCRTAWPKGQTISEIEMYDREQPTLLAICWPVIPRAKRASTIF